MICARANICASGKPPPYNIEATFVRDSREAGSLPYNRVTNTP